MNKKAIIIALTAIGYTVALTLIIISACYGDYSNLYLLFPILITPTMALFIRTDAEDNDFWTLFAIFMATVGSVSCIAMPLTLYSINAYGDRDIQGLSYGLGSSLTLLSFIGITGFIAAKHNDDIW